MGARHSSLRTAAARGSRPLMQAFGNREAHRVAQEAAGWHPAQVETLRAVCRTADLSSRLCRYYARFLDRLLVGGLMLEPSPLWQIFSRPRPPAIPRHTVAVDRLGQERCVRCLLPLGLLEGRPCRPAGALGHAFVAVGCGTACRRCGAYTFKAVRHLALECRGRPRDAAAAWRLWRVLAGRHPVQGSPLGQPAVVDPAL